MLIEFSVDARERYLSWFYSRVCQFICRQNAVIVHAGY